MITASVTRRCLLSVADFSAEELDAVLDMAALMKRHPLAWRSALAGRAVACVFEHAAARDRVSLEVAVHRLGALPVVIEPRGDSIDETARELSACCDAITVRTTRHRDLLEFGQVATVPVVNALTNLEHPCAALADCLVLRERFGALADVSVAYVGPQEPAMRSLIEAAILTGLTVRVAAPAAHLLDPALIARAGERVRVCENVREATDGAAVVYTSGAARPPDAAANLLPVEQAVLRAIVTGDWEV